MTQKPKQIDLLKIPFADIESGLRIEGRFTLKNVENLDWLIGGLCDLDLSLNAADDNLILVDGSFSFTAQLDCGRCLKVFTREIENKVSTEGECTDAFFNLQAIIEEELLSNLSITYVCKDTCKGLCDKCGADLNIRSCGCSN